MPSVRRAILGGAGMIKGIFHVNVNCSNFERSLEFYKALGFRVVVDMPEGGSPEMDQGLGLKNGIGRAAIMQIGDDPRGTRLDLIEWKSPPSKGKPYAKLNHLGIARIALFTKNLYDTYDELKSKGVRFISEPVVLKTPAGDTPYACFYDPDGTILELIEPGRPSPAQEAQQV
jgi:catechol 2,3-dioxygenase-like lactoylglutathione lyase family enzyme